MENQSVTDRCAVLLRHVLTLTANLENVQASLDRLEMLVSTLSDSTTFKVTHEEIDTTASKRRRAPSVYTAQKKQKQTLNVCDEVYNWAREVVTTHIGGFPLPVLPCNAIGEVSHETHYTCVHEGTSYCAGGLRYLALPQFFDWLRVQYPAQPVTRPLLCRALRGTGWRAVTVRAVSEQDGRQLTRQRRYWCKPVDVGHSR